MSSSRPAGSAKRTWYISTINLFEHLSAREIDDWINRCGTRMYEAGSRIIDAASSAPERVVVIRRGAVTLSLQRDRGRSEIVDVLGPGQLLGVSAAFGSTRGALNADALTRVVVCESEGRDFLLQLATGPNIVLNLVRQLGSRVVQFDGHYRVPGAAPAPQRLILVLERLALTAGRPEPAGKRLPSCVTRATLAHQVGCTRETIARMLAQLEANGAVARHRRAIVVDLDRLHEELAHRSKHSLDR